MNRERTLNTIGFALLAACFIVALVRVFNRNTEETQPGTITIRFAHWQLESGLRDAFDEVARRYMEAHPGIRVEQLAIPERTYAQYYRTQLIGGTAPDIFAIGFGNNDEILARFFTPLTPWLERPNPFNVGTELEGIPWRDTFIDGLNSKYNQNLLDYYMISTAMFTVRVYYNKTLWQEILGDAPVPETYEDFRLACEKIRDFARDTGRGILPIASSKFNGPQLMDKLFEGQTQKLRLSLDPVHVLNTGNVDVVIPYLKGEWSMETPAIRSAVELSHEVAGFMTPGFSQLGREDAAFYFVQNRAVMIVSGSWDATSLRSQAPFEIGVFAVPLPSRDHPTYGRFTLGRASEGDTSTEGSFGIVRQSPHFEVALDFLQYLTSQPGNQVYADESGWLPAIIGVTPDPLIEPFMPVIDGELRGFFLKFNDIGANTKGLYENAISLLERRDGVESYIRTMTSRLPEAIREDLDLRVKNNKHNTIRQDTTIAALRSLDRLGDRTTDYAAKLTEVLEAQNGQEGETYRIEQELRFLQK
ncbi:MAG: extracellular solute-binding protein [Opitutaceae bacterium]